MGEQGTGDQEYKHVKCCMSTERNRAKKRNGQTNPTFHKINAPKENGRVLPQSGHGWRMGAPAVSSQRSAVGRWWRGVVGRL